MLLFNLPDGLLELFNLALVVLRLQLLQLLLDLIELEALSSVNLLLLRHSYHHRLLLGLKALELPL